MKCLIQFRLSAIAATRETFNCWQIQDANFNKAQSFSPFFFFIVTPLRFLFCTLRKNMMETRCDDKMRKKSNLVSHFSPFLLPLFHANYTLAKLNGRKILCFFLPLLCRLCRAAICGWIVVNRQQQAMLRLSQIIHINILLTTKGRQPASDSPLKRQECRIQKKWKNEEKGGNCVSSEMERHLMNELLHQILML